MTTTDEMMGAGDFPHLPKPLAERCREAFKTARLETLSQQGRTDPREDSTTDEDANTDERP